MNQDPRVSHAARCAACLAIEDEERRRVRRYRMLEDVASAFAFVGLLCWLRQIGYSARGTYHAIHRIFPDFRGGVDVEKYLRSSEWTIDAIDASDASLVEDGKERAT